jgi:transcriptional regulator with XRE-family HTH domain
MTISSERLKALRLEKGTKQKELAALLSIQERTYRQYEAGEVDPPTSKTILLADFFQVSLDFITSRSDDRTLHKSEAGTT